MQMLKWLFILFTPYVRPFEWRVDRFFRSVKSGTASTVVQERLQKLMQRNLLVLTLWMEKKYKGYSYLTKWQRNRLYGNAEKLLAKFEQFVKSRGGTLGDLRVNFHPEDRERLLYISQIMMFLAPGGIYKYIRTTSFGKLLRDPDEQKLEGDCNQIVTLYAYLYSLRYPLEDLKVKLLPEHVCLHFKGVDIEATTGKFAHYDQHQILPITELVSTNLLDLSDFREGAQHIEERVMVKSAQLAYKISSLKSLVATNLRIAYKNLAIAALRVKDFDAAIFYFREAGEGELSKKSKYNAAIWHLKKEHFAKAKRYAINDKELLKKIEKLEAAKAYNKLVAKVSGVKELSQARKFRKTYKMMLKLAEKMGDREAVDNIRKTLSKL